MPLVRPGETIFTPLSNPDGVGAHYLEVAQEITARQNAAANGLWTPGFAPEIRAYTQPTPEEFRERFATGVWDEKTEIVNLDGSLNALRPTTEPPSALVLLDMDDLLGNLGGSLRQLQHPPNGHDDSFTHNYGDKMFFKDNDTATKHPLIRLVKNHDQPGIGMRPVEDIEPIVSMVRSWRSAGAYVAVITSAIDGAELSHVDFLAKHFRGACDGIVITSGHYELVDKGEAAIKVANYVGVRPGTPTIHLDDIHWNTQKVRRALEVHPAGLQVATFQHVFPHPSHLGKDPGSGHGGTPFETFMLANDFLTEKLGRVVHIPLARVLEQV